MTSNDSRSGFPFGGQCTFRVYREPIRSYGCFSLVSHDDLSISAARGHVGPEVTSPIDSVTSVSQQCSIHISCLVCTIRKLYAYFLSFILVECRFWRLGGVILEMISQVDRAITFFSLCCTTFSVYLQPFRHDKRFFSIVENGVMTISAARG
jgi:hypothetical protein